MTQTNQEQQKKIYTGEPRRDLKLLKGPADSGDKPYWMLFDPMADSYYRLTDEKKQIIAALDHNYPLDEFIVKLQRNGINATEKEILETIHFLQNNMLLVPGYGNVEKIYRMKKQAKKKTRLQQWTSAVTYLKFPPIHPEKFFASTASFVSSFFNKYFTGTLIFLTICGYIALIKNWSLAATMLMNNLCWSGMAKYTLAILFMKTIHECAHAYRAATYGIRVRSIGISIIFFMPRIFTDLTDAWQLPRKKRLAIDAAGIYSEIIVGGIAAVIWAIVPPGTLHSTMFFIFSTSVINTILVNGNPFIRFDGYYILMDITNTDNLMTRSNELIRNWWRRNFFGVPAPKPENLSLHKQYFMFFFGLGAYIYRLFLYTTIVLVIYNKFTKPIALVLLALEVWTLLLLPLYREINFLTRMKNKLKSFRIVSSAAGIIIIILIICLPLPWQISMPCELRAEKSSMLTVPQSGYIKKSLASREREIKSGELIVELSNPTLEAELHRAKLDHKRNQEELEQYRSETALLPFSRKKLEDLNASKVLIKELEAQQKNLLLQSPINGKFVSPDKNLKAGRWLNKGTVIGEVLSNEVKFYAYLPAGQVEKLKINDLVTIVLNGKLEKLKGRISSINPLPAKLKQSPLIQQFGGDISCHYSKEESRFIPNIPHYRIIISLDGPYQGAYGRVGTAHIRKYTSIGGSTLRYALQVLQRELSF